LLHGSWYNRYAHSTLRWLSEKEVGISVSLLCWDGDFWNWTARIWATVMAVLPTLW